MWIQGPEANNYFIDLGETPFNLQKAFANRKDLF